MSFSDNEKLFDFGLSYSYDEDLLFGFSRSRDLVGSDLVERNSRIWGMFLFDTYSITPSLIYSKDNSDRYGLGTELSFDYFLNNELTILLSASVIRYREEILERGDNFTLKGREDYTKSSLSYGLEYMILDGLVTRVLYKKYFYDDLSSVSLINNSGTVVSSRKDFSITGQNIETLSLSTEYKVLQNTFYISVDRTPLISFNQDEYWYVAEYSRQISKKIEGSLLLEYENIEDTTYYGFGLKYRY